MIRETLGASSPHAMMVLTPGNGAAFQYRAAAGGLSTHVDGGAAAAPLWVRVVRGGNTLSGYRSADGVNWTLVGSTTIAMAAQVQVGLAVTAHNDGALNTATFDNVAVVATPAPTFGTARINFQPAGAPAYSGYLVDGGAVYAARNGRTYGWRAVNNTMRDRNSTRSPDQRYDTLIHLQKPEAPNAVWEIAVPNGSYAVRVVAGDAGHHDSVYRINAEGVLAVSGTPTSSVRWFEGRVTVNVADGRLTISNGSGASNNKICFIEITQTTAAAGTAAMTLSMSTAADPISTPVKSLTKAQRRQTLSMFYGPTAETATAVVTPKRRDSATAALLD
jgi:hypothetical protein